MKIPGSDLLIPRGEYTGTTQPTWIWKIDDNPFMGCAVNETSIIVRMEICGKFRKKNQKAR